MKKTVLIVLGGTVLLLSILAGRVMYNIRDRHPDYQLAVDIRTGEAPLSVGASAVAITPEIIDTWTDVNGDARYNPDDGDTFQDRNNNGAFDPVWIAGFHKGRPATGIHDDLWARAMVIDNSQTRIAIVALDAIGFMHDDVVDVRKMLPDSVEIDYAIISSTHDHQAPDLIGIWGRNDYSCGVNDAYMRMVKKNIVTAIVQATRALRPARLRFAQDLAGARPLVSDTRRPTVLDAGVRIMHAIDAEADTTLGTIVAWANHPETLWNRNLMISSDFPHFVREYVEKGVVDSSGVFLPGLGGTVLYINGAVGGLMTTPPEQEVRSLSEFKVWRAPTFDKIRAQGERLAALVLSALRGDNVQEVTTATVRVRARTVVLPLANKGFRLGAMLGVIRRGFTGGFSMRSEVAALQLGPASFLAVPGEIYPEIINGGIEAPPGRDFDIQPVEVPPLRRFMPGEFRFVIGLANDEIGYIIPRSEWDEKPPYLYGAQESPYGEVNSLGPETAPLLYTALRELLADLEK